MIKLKYLFLLGLFATAGVLNAQVKFGLSLLPDQETYLLSIKAEKSWTAPRNITGSVQVVVKVPADVPFIAGKIQSLIPGLSWSDNALVVQPSAAPGYNFVCFVLNEPGTKNIPFEEGVETPLFTFKNLEPGRTAKLELTLNDDPMVQKVVKVDHFNITQNITVLGANGNAFTGIFGHTPSTTTAVPQIELLEKLKVYPVPAMDFIQVNWESHAAKAELPSRLQAMNAAGQVIATYPLNKQVGQQSLRVDVSAWPAGLYVFKVQTDLGKIQSFKCLVMRK